jgi:hypothetical protein
VEDSSRRGSREASENPRFLWRDWGIAHISPVAGTPPKIASLALLFLRNEKCPLTLPQERDSRYRCRIAHQAIKRPIMNMLPVDRALAIYGTVADRSEPKDARKRLSQHLQKVFTEGEHDPHRLTVHGLSYLQKLDRERDS